MGLGVVAVFGKDLDSSVVRHDHYPVALRELLFDDRDEGGTRTSSGRISTPAAPWAASESDRDLLTRARPSSAALRARSYKL